MLLLDKALYLDLLAGLDFDQSLALQHQYSSSECYSSNVSTPLVIYSHFFDIKHMSGFSSLNSSVVIYFPFFATTDICANVDSLYFTTLQTLFSLSSENPGIALE